MHDAPTAPLRNRRAAQHLHKQLPGWLSLTRQEVRVPAALAEAQLLALLRESVGFDVDGADPASG